MNVLNILFFTQFIFVSGECIVINITNGKIKGSLKTTVPAGNAYFAFKDIRYAEPPNRFEPSVPVKKWTEIYDATEDKSICIQIVPNTFEQSEDCLYISVYTPNLPGDISQNLPVMFWVYGGTFLNGDNLYSTYAPDYLLDNGVVVVTINYRLNILGFLSTGDELVPGNNGLKDVILGLKWVQENIKFFGGDPGQVTMFGQSAGAALISYIIQSPLVMGKGYFQRAILQSGNSLSQWARQKNPERIFNLIVAGHVCGTLQPFGHRAVLNCLKGAPIKTIMTTTTAVLGFGLMLQWRLNGLGFAPVYEAPSPTAAITHPAYQSIPKEVSNIPIIMGITSEETITMLKMLLIIRPLLLQIDLKPSILVPNDMNGMNSDIKNFVIPAIRSYYFDNGPVVTSKKAQIIRYTSDVFFNKPFREYLTLVKNNDPIYCYQFSYSSQLNAKYQNGGGSEGVGHGGELNFLFRVLDENVRINDKDMEIIKQVTRLWTNFAKTGNPTPMPNDTMLNNLTWPTAWRNETNVDCLNIAKTLTIFRNPKEEGYQFWKKLYDVYGHPIDTYR